MKKLIILFFLPIFVFSQQVFDSQLIYQDPQGVFDESIVRDLSINFYDDDYHDFLIDSWFNNTKLRQPASFDMGGVYYDTVAVRYKGNSTFYIPWSVNNSKLPFNIDMNQYVIGQNILGYDKLKLANSLFDPSMRKEITGLSVYREYMPASQSNFINLTVNDELIGLYVNTESINLDFMDKHFNENDGVFFKCESQDLFGVEATSLVSSLDYRGVDSLEYYESYELKSAYGWEELIQMIYTLNHDIENIEKYLNVDRVLWYLAVNTSILNADTYNLVNIRNYYMYQTANGQFQIIPWDVSESFIGALYWWWGDPQNLYEASPYYGYDPYIEDRPLIYNLLSIERYKQNYDAHLRTIVNQIINTSFISDKVYNLGDVASYNAQLDPNTFFGDGFESNVNEDYWFFNGQWNTFGGILNTLDARSEFLNNHPLMMANVPVIENVTQNIALPNPDDEVVVSAQVFGSEEVELMITTQSDHFNFQSYSMNDSGVDGDQVAGDNIFSAIIPFSNPGDYVQYYVRAVNQDGVALSPEKAEFEFYFYTVNYNVISSDIVINEIMASNDNIVADEFGEYDDWIEIYNKGSNSINIANYHLSDNLSILDKYTFPDVTLSPDQYFIIWADDDEEEQGDYNHATFKLSASGEEVYLSDPNLNIIDVCEFEEQDTDMGYARVPNGIGEFTIQNPTFSANNDELSSLLDVKQNQRQLLRVVDVLGRDYSPNSTNTTILYLYDDGSVQKQCVLK